MALADVAVRPQPEPTPSLHQHPPFDLDNAAACRRQPAGDQRDARPGAAPVDLEYVRSRQIVAAQNDCR